MTHLFGFGLVWFGFTLWFLIKKYFNFMGDTPTPPLGVIFTSDAVGWMRLGFHDIKKLFIQIVVRPPYRIHPMRPPSGGPEASEAAPVRFNSIFNLSCVNL